MNRNLLSEFKSHEYHKGFYNDMNPLDTLKSIQYEDYFEKINDDKFAVDTAYELLCGSCNHFAVMLKNVLGYNVYVITGKEDKVFHAFGQIYIDEKWYYIDARGITTSFSEFMEVGKNFVKDEYVIRLANSIDYEEWEKDCLYNREIYAFAKALIENFRECYVLEE